MSFKSSIGPIFVAVLFAVFSAIAASAQSALPPCPTSRKLLWTDCQGTYVYDDWTKYVGEFKDDKKHGRGVIVYPDGKRYAGGFKSDLRDGPGVYTGPDGNSWTGEFRDDRPNGKGVLTDKSGKVLKSGFWRDGVYVGEEPPAP